MKIIKITEVEGLKIIHAIDDDEQTPEQEALLWSELFKVLSTAI